MRMTKASQAAAKEASLCAGRRDNAPVQLVCIALVLATIMLAFRIVIVW